MTLNQSDDKQQWVRNVSFRHAYFFNLYAYLQAQRSHKKRDIAKDIKVMTAWGLHLFPFRTEKLNLTAPMVLRKWESRSLPPKRSKARANARALFVISRCVCTPELPRRDSIDSSYSNYSNYRYNRCDRCKRWDRYNRWNWGDRCDRD